MCAEFDVDQELYDLRRRQAVECHLGVKLGRIRSERATVLKGRAYSVFSRDT